MKLKPDIAQATIVFSLVSHQRGLEFTVTWAQKPEMAQFLEGKFFDFPDKELPFSRTSAGKPRSYKDVNFTSTGTKIPLEDGQTYAALIGINLNAEVPFILCVADYAEWKQHQLDAETTFQEAEATRAICDRLNMQLPVQAAPKSPKKNSKLPSFRHSAPVAIDATNYFLELLGNEFRGTLTQIMAHACAVWGEDPTEAIQDFGKWKKRIQVAGNYAAGYVTCDCPTLPKPNLMAIEAAKHKYVTPA
ncbi:MAG: hypothetical protein V4686_01915 [Patescibacteria group bacterium]